MTSSTTEIRPRPDTATGTRTTAAASWRSTAEELERSADIEAKHAVVAS